MQVNLPFDAKVYLAFFSSSTQSLIRGARRKHRKCDETLPVCLRCQNIGEPCIRSNVDLNAPRKKLGFRGFKMVSLPAPLSITSANGEKLGNCPPFEYFTLHTLPFLRTCQPSVLWTTVINHLCQSHKQFRIIAAAIGSQHRLSIEGPSDSSTSSVEQVDAAYDNAIHSLRLFISTWSQEDPFPPAFASLLMVILASMRGSTSEMLIHLQCGIRIACGSEITPATSKEAREMARVLRQLGVSTMLFERLISPDGEMQKLMCSTVPVEKDPQNDDDLLDLAFELYEIITGLFSATSDYGTTPRQGDADFEWLVDLSQLKLRLLRVERMLDKCKANQNESEVFSDIFYDLCRARTNIVGVQLETAWSGQRVNPDRNTVAFERILDQLESCILRLEADGQGSAPPFSIGLGLMSSLQLIILNCACPRAQRRAVDLFYRCPQQEGLWNAREQGYICSRLIDESVETPS